MHHIIYPSSEVTLEGINKFFLLFFAFALLCVNQASLANVGAEHSITITEPLEETKKASDFLYPPIKSYNEGSLKVSDIHTLWYAEYGNSEGVPIVFIHGGPGSGCGRSAMRFFDPNHYRIILFDQRGSKRSTPLGEIKDNTTEHLVGDLESLRTHLKIDKWVIFGGSWGVALGLAYGEAHPARCLGFILRGVFLGTAQEDQNHWSDNGGLFPDAWNRMNRFIPKNERTNLARAYHKRIFSPDIQISGPAIDAINAYDVIKGSLYLPPEELKETLEDKNFCRSFARSWIHYSVNFYFLKNNQLLANIHKVSHLPAIIINGRYDVMCPMKAAYDLYQKWPNSHLVIVSNAGHAANEVGITKILVEATNRFKELVKSEGRH